MNTPTFFLLLFASFAALEIVLRKQAPRERVLLLGSGPLAVAVVRELESQPRLHCTIVGVVEEEAVPIPAALARHARLGTRAELSRIVEELKPDRIVVALADKLERLSALELLEHQLRGIEVQEGVELLERLTGKVSIETLQPGSQLFRESFRCSATQDRLARAVSLGCATLGIVLLAPLLLVIAVAIKLGSAGPVLFRQMRIGLGGRPFELLKFRTMRAATEAGSEWVADNCGRITGVGELLRRLRLDELPQFVNLLRGEMNLVGPRPHPLSNLSLFAAQIPFYSLRCLVRPGLTGWAQIRYRYANNLAEETEKMRYDLYYIKHRSAWLDMKIIPATLRAVILGKGASGDLETPALATRFPLVPSLVPALALATLPLLAALPVRRAENGRARLEWTSGAAVDRWRGGALIVEQ